MTAEEWKDGFWAFVVEHSRPHENGNYMALFGYSDKGDLFRRIHARASGKYNRDTVNWWKHWEAQKRATHWHKQRNDKINKMKEKHFLTWKLVTLLTKLRNYLIDSCT